MQKQPSASRTGAWNQVFAQPGFPSCRHPQPHVSFSLAVAVFFQGSSNFFTSQLAPLLEVLGVLLPRKEMPAPAER